MDWAFLKRLSDAPGLPGDEAAVRLLLAERLARFGPEVRTDALGNLIAHFEGPGPRVLLQAHLDEVGFLISRIEAEGFLRVMPLGGLDPRVVYGQAVVVHGRRDLPGVVATTPPHLSGDKAGEKVVPLEDCLIDLGLPPEEVAESVRLGDGVTFATRAWENETSFFGKALDDRAGLFALTEALGLAARIDCDLHLVGSVQEEYGLRGAGPAAFSVRPEVALALEGTFATDLPDPARPANLTPTGLGKGPEIRLTDKNLVADRGLVEFLACLARERGIPHQVIVKKGGTTDATAIQTSAAGVRTTALAVPIRYIHAPVGLLDKSDLENTARLLAAFLETASRFK